ncbi:MAG: sugar ABC transporter permease [Oscillospiraceae bacterium]|nr:sugar ABC transporter permease [Oscillospiraceae bacterium]
MKIGKKLFGALAIPCGVFLACMLIGGAKGVTLFDSQLSFLTFVRAAANVALVTFALSINLNSGRFDFSIGSISLLSSVLSSMITVNAGLGPVAMLLLSILFGGVLGLLSGVLYVSVKLPPIIVSLAVALFYDGLAFTLTGGHGVTFASNNEILGFGTIPNYLLITVAATLFMYILFDCTKFGYEYKALLSGQKVAVNTGIREIPNAVGCYTVAGLLMGAQGFISATNNGSITMSLNFGSISPMFMAFLPMFIGGFIGRYVNDKIGYLLGAVASAMISLVYVRLNVSSSTQQIISACLMVGFLIYLNNEGVFKNLFRAKTK